MLGRAIVRPVGPTDPIPTVTRTLSIGGARRTVWVPVGNRLYGATANPGSRPRWVLVEIRRLTLAEPGTLYSTQAAAIQAACEREQPD